jgi:hypothetical protein
LKDQLARNLKELQTLSVPKLLEDRYRKYRRIGVFEEAAREKIAASEKKLRNGAVPKKAALKSRAKTAK